MTNPNYISRVFSHHLLITWERMANIGIHMRMVILSVVDGGLQPTTITRTTFLAGCSILTFHTLGNTIRTILMIQPIKSREILLVLDKLKMLRTH